MEPIRSEDPAGELSEDDARGVERVVQRLRKARRVLAVTGAGMSADSGMPTYRGVGGLYRSERLTPHGIAIEEVLSGPMFEARPDLTWNYLKEIERACRGARPNRGHEVLAEMDDYFDAVWILTQNVDGLHQEAGSKNVLDVHGDLHTLRCTNCDRRSRVDDYDGFDDLPRCPACKGVLRPDVVLFNESVDPNKIRRLEIELMKGFDLVFSIGTSSLFDYIVAPLRFAQAAGKPTVEINPDFTAMTDLVDVKIRARAALALDRIWDDHLAWWPHT
ncbi:SIR2 family NAD-dependent protein deacylase [Planctomyces sp. SH-PL62]|uniref:SIR2 family NAD-dependent protein deacylase n=1 Tax=Planctomyces sp. SH-PL62 TaxID=1636152 RepID=UPI00078B60F9|nr:NAD-dependent deacylase [Planctomyces sp. SH-PL62]AMV39052.1 NAD-dependent protein deacetylase [Planctomyces sp. SH-PL62]